MVILKAGSQVQLRVGRIMKHPMEWALTRAAFVGEMERGREQFWMGNMAGAAL